MDIELAWQARRDGCSGCNWWRRSVTVSGEQPYGTCHVSPPRTSAQQQWPITMADRHCGAFLPVPRLP